MFLNRERVIPSAQVSSVRREEPDTEIASSSIWNSPVSEKQLPFNPSAWGHLFPRSYCDVGKFFYRVFKF